jgi:hypothetical protein
MEDEDMFQDTTESIENELENLKEFNNEKQLDILRREISFIVAHGLFPPEGWFDERYEYIDLYSKLDWLALAKSFHNRDQYIHDTSLCIFRLLEELIEERGTKPNFHIRTYHSLIHNIQNIWQYYKQTYNMTDEDDEMMNVINGISRM